MWLLWLGGSAMALAGLVAMLLAQSGSAVALPRSLQVGVGVSTTLTTPPTSSPVRSVPPTNATATSTPVTPTTLRPSHVVIVKTREPVTDSGDQNSDGNDQSTSENSSSQTPSTTLPTTISTTVLEN